jgi:hypothetical protein
MESATVVAVIGLALAWLLYRMERAGTRGREIAAARSVLLAVKRGMVDGLADETGWGERYFTTNWTPERAEDAAKAAAEKVLAGGYDQVLVVPTDPLRALIASPHAGDLISEDVVYYANVGLWHLVVFNQLVEQQSQLVAQHLAEIADADTNAQRRDVIARAIGAQARMLHGRGVGEPYTASGWYRRLKDEVNRNIARLDCDREKHAYPPGERRLAVGDMLAALAVMAVGLVLLLENARGGNEPNRLPPATTPTMTTG